jgi:hypothetical protein
MKKLKYERPTSKNLNSFDVALGSCFSGSGEQSLQGCEPGSVAVDPCSAGDTVYPRDVCTDGGFAGASCFNGTDAG